MNNCTFAGRLGKDAETKYTQSGDSVTGFSIAVDVGWGKNKSTLWIDCSLWGERGEKLAPYLTKGSMVCVSGEISTFEANNGKTYLKLRVAELTLCGSKTEGGQQQQPRQERREPQQQQQAMQQVTPAQQRIDDDFEDDLIPF